MKRETIAKYIDHTLLKAVAGPRDIELLCEEAKEHGFYAVCLNPHYVKLAAEILSSSWIKVASVIGYPLGASVSAVKVFEAQQALRDGADELDMVINIGMLKAGEYEKVKKEIEAVHETMKTIKDDALLKVIIETAVLSAKEIEIAAEILLETGAEYVKTSTGFDGGAKIEDVKFLKKKVGDKVLIKASGGIRTFESAKALIEAGASRIGTSSGKAIVSYE